MLNKIEHGAKSRVTTFHTEKMANKSAFSKHAHTIHTSDDDAYINTMNIVSDCSKSCFILHMQAIYEYS